MLSADSRAFEIRTEAMSVGRLAVLALAFAGSLAIAAQVRIPLPFTPVPITLQTFVLYVGAAWLGTRAALTGLAAYVGLAFLGVPVMSGLRGGLAAFGGATGGYILGWFVAGLIVSRMLSGTEPSRRLTVATLALGSACILSLGTLHLALLLDLAPGQAFLMGFAPFIPGDVAKILTASVVLRRWPNPRPLR